MSQKGFSALIVGLVALIVAWSSLFVISERERAVQLRFGQLVKDDIQPGLHVSRSRLWITCGYSTVVCRIWKCLPSVS